MRRALSVLTLSLALLLPAATAARAQGPQSPVSSDAVQGASEAGAAAVQQEPAAGAGGLPTRTAPPRTLRAHWHVYVAFAVAWLLLFGYALMLGRRFSALEREIRRLERGGAA